MWDRYMISGEEPRADSKQLMLFNHSIRRVYHHYDQWEEYKHGMWRTANIEPGMLEKAIAFTGDAELYGSHMRRVIVEWPISCEQNLTCKGMNRLAWVGHAACCLAIGCPEQLTRAAWHYLTQEQQDDANAQAANAVETWERRYLEEGQAR